MQSISLTLPGVCYKHRVSCTAHLLDTCSVYHFSFSICYCSASLDKKDNDDDDSNDDDEDDMLEPLTARERLIKSRSEMNAKKKAAVSSSSPMERAKHAVESYMNMKFDAGEELKDQLKRMGKDHKSIDWERVKKNDTLYISSHFDSREWWVKVGRKVHPLVFLVVPAIIALPASNGFQERTFSTCTFFDDPLRQSLKDARFEMAVLLAVNEELLSGEVPSEDEAKKIVEKVVAKFADDADLLDSCSDLFKD